MGRKYTSGIQSFLLYLHSEDLGLVAFALPLPAWVTKATTTVTACSPCVVHVVPVELGKDKTAALSDLEAAC